MAHTTSPALTNLGWTPTNHHWHSEFPASLKLKTDESLAFMAKDIVEAIDAQEAMMRAGVPYERTSLSRYYDERSYVAMERKRRRDMTLAQRVAEVLTQE